MKQIVILSFLFGALSISAQNLYFPGNDTVFWDTLALEDLEWSSKQMDSVYTYLDSMDSKAFIILKDGKIAAEKYFGTFTKDSIWYWASAGKTLTAILVGIAQEEGYLSIEDSSSHYLDSGWTNLTPEQEGRIKIRHQLTMTTGLDDFWGDCTDDTCLQYLADTGTRWAYHNAPYTLLDQVIENATGKNYNMYFYQKISSKLNMGGIWLKTGSNNVFYSKARSMARYGLCVLNNGIWDTDTILGDKVYFENMINTSQDFNPSYGYLWWLNGKGSYMLPKLQWSFDTDLIPSAPNDLIAALGKNDQKIYVVPSQNLVVVRMGNASGSSKLALSSFDTGLWEELQKVFDAVPESPSQLNITKESEDVFDITWKDNADNEAGFVIERKVEDMVSDVRDTVYRNEENYTDTIELSGKNITYKVYAFNKNGNSDTIFQQYNVPLNISNEQSEIKMYPNPANEILYVEGCTNGDEISIFDITGSKLKACIVQEEKYSIDLSSIPVGIFLVRVRTENGVVIKKVIKSLD